MTASSWSVEEGVVHVDLFLVDVCSVRVGISRLYRYDHIACCSMTV